MNNLYLSQLAQINNPPQVNLLDLLLQGGWAMIPLATISLCLIVLIFHCWQISAARQFQFHPQPHDKSLLAARVIPPENLLSQKDNEDRNEWIASRLDEEEGKISRWIQYLNVLASISPMVGLLGTVSGMIGAFQTIAAGGMGKPEYLAGDIGEALITTATGLTIAIPAMIAYFFFRNRLDANMTQLTNQIESHLSAYSLQLNTETDQ